MIHLKKHWNYAQILLILLLFPPEVFSQGQYFEKGTLQLTATDNDGWASLSTYIYQWDDERRDWQKVDSGDTKNGKINYSLAPGVYQLKMYYKEASPGEYRTVEGIQISDKGVVARDEYFEKGTLRLTATDNDGWASLSTYMYQWDDEKRDWQKVDSGDTKNGNINYSLAPGVYQLKMYYKEASPGEYRTVEGIQISDKGVVARDEYFEKGTLRLTATDNDGWASLSTYMYQWDDEKRDWQKVDSGDTKNGKINYSLAPGVYQLKMYYKEASPGEYRTVEGIRISDKGVVARDEYFEKGTFQLTATDNDGWASLSTYMYQWDDEKRDWQKVDSGDTKNGKINYSLAPGVYQLKMYYKEASPGEYRTVEGIQISDKGVVARDEYFEKGTLRLTATDNDGWASLSTYMYQWDDEKRDWQKVDSGDTKNGKINYSLAPGVYQLKMYYKEASPGESRTVEGIRISDRQAQAIGETFGGGNLPPIISTGGPFEIGDGDGYYEVGEKVLFRIDIHDNDFDSVEFLINNKVIRKSDRPGKYEQLLTLSVPGDYKFSVRAKDRTGTIESYGRTIPVSMQKERTLQSAKYLPAEYGQNKRINKCPKCGEEYHDDTAYCPQDGNKLTVVQRVIHGGLDASLATAGIEPRTAVAEHAKELSLDWLNPFSSQEEIDQDIQQLVDDVMKK